MVGALQGLCRQYKEAKAHSWEMAGVRGKPTVRAALLQGGENTLERYIQHTLRGSSAKLGRRVTLSDRASLTNRNDCKCRNTRATFARTQRREFGCEGNALGEGGKLQQVDVGSGVPATPKTKQASPTV